MSRIINFILAFVYSVNMVMFAIMWLAMMIVIGMFIYAIADVMIGKYAHAYVPLNLLHDVHCMVEIQHIPESEKGIAMARGFAMERKTK